MPLSTAIFLQHARTSPIALLRLIWVWEWHAFLLWLLFAALAAPLVAVTLTPLLARIQGRIQRHEPPILP